MQKNRPLEASLEVPPEVNLSDDAKDLIESLLCDVEVRLGTNGVDEIKQHSFFEGSIGRTFTKSKRHMCLR